MSKEEPCVTVRGRDHVGRGNDCSYQLLFPAEPFWFIVGKHAEKQGTRGDASTCEGVCERPMPLVWETARVVGRQSHLEWPLRVFFLVAILVVVRESLDAHISNMPCDCCQLGMRSHEAALICREVDVRVVVDCEEVERLVAFEGVKRHHVR